MTKRYFGFTLIEVMVALAIFAIAGTALLSTTETNLTQVSRLEQRQIAAWVAANRLVEVNLSNKWPPQNNRKGDVKMLDKKWYWTQKVVKTTDKSMRAVTIEVRVKEDDKNPIASLTTYVAKQAQAASQVQGGRR